ncbi:MAG: GHKL domain-containing protein [Clostridiales bacterium]|nr:GHKL domain-containing protein [Clostridiales bacterium]
MDILSFLLYFIPVLASGMIFVYILHSVIKVDIRHAGKVSAALLILGILFGITSSIFCFSEGDPLSSAIPQRNTLYESSDGIMIFTVSTSDIISAISALFILISSVVLFIFIKEKWWKKLLILICASQLLDNIVMIFRTLGEMLPDVSGDIARLIICTAVYLLTFVFFLLIAMIRKRNDNKQAPLPLLLILSLSVTIVGQNIIDNAYNNDYSEINVSQRPIVVTFLLITLVAVVIYFYFRSLAKERSDLKDLNRTNEELIKAQTRYFENSVKADKEIRAMRHDMRNNIQVLSLLLESGKTDEMRKYLQEMGDNLKSTDIIYHTGNSIADAIISEKRSEALEQGITINVSGVLADIDLSPVDTCKILANLLDNAIESYGDKELQSLDPKCKTIDLEFRKTDNFFLISCSNHCTSALAGKDNIFNGEASDPYTSKSNKKDHGLGLYNIRNAASAHNGEVTVSIDSDGHLTVFKTEIVFELSDGS